MHLLNGIDFLEAHQDIIFSETTSEFWMPLWIMLNMNGYIRNYGN